MNKKVIVNLIVKRVQDGEDLREVLKDFNLKVIGE